MSVDLTGPGEHPSDRFRRRTVVLRLPVASLVPITDLFDSLASRCKLSDIEALGTVGVGHVYHVTFFHESKAISVVKTGNFQVRGVPVVVQHMPTVSFTVFVHWVPYWVPHGDVERSLEKVLMGNYRCSYVRVAQKGYPDCYSTQRRVRSVVDVRKLPHFLTVSSQGLNYRAFIFVPGREPVCFKCGQEGHMRDKCEVDVSRPVTHQELTVSLPQSSEVADSVISPVRGPDTPPFDRIFFNTGSIPDLPKACQSDQNSHTKFSSAYVEGKELDVSTPHTINNSLSHAEDMKKRAAQAEETVGFYMEKFDVVPPRVTVKSKTSIKKCATRCVTSSCYLMDSFLGDQISFEDMVVHCVAKHMVITRVT